MIKVLFVCIGNICRSPMAEAIFKFQVEQAGLGDHIFVDSAGTTNYHEGEKAHATTRKVCEQRGINAGHLSRPIRPRDLFEFHYVLNMERSVHETVLQLSQSRSKAISKIELMRDHDPLPHSTDEVPDPYLYNEAAFEDVFQILDRSCAELLKKIRSEHKI